MLITIKFHRALRKLTNNTKEYSINVETYDDIFRAFVNIFPNFKRFIDEKRIAKRKNEELSLIVDGKILKYTEFLMPVKGEEFVLVPLVTGTGRSGMLIAALALIFIGVVLIVAAPVIAPAFGVVSATGDAALVATAATATAVSAGTITTVGLVIAGLGLLLLASSLAPKPRKNPSETVDDGTRRNNDIFEGLTNTISPSTPVYLNYGEMRVAGQYVSGYIKTVNHGKNADVNLYDNITEFSN